MRRALEIMDTTLRDGEQTSGVSFTSLEKLTLAKLLLQELKVDRIEIASARVSDGEFNAVKEITSWASSQGLIEAIEVLTFVDNGVSIQWMKEAGAQVQNLLTKGSMNHLKHQLNQTPEQHFKNISISIKEAEKEGFKTNIYLEDWSNGMQNSEDYVFKYLDFLATQPIERILLPDTLGVLTPEKTAEYLNKIIKRYPNIRFDFHGHNDYDLSVANAMEAVKAGVNGLHLTVNGMGERAGNAPLASVVAVINDFLPDTAININENALHQVSKLVATFTGFRIPANKPIVGENVFTQTAGIHADGDNKTTRIIELGDKKERVTAEDLPFIISDVLGNNLPDKVKIQSYVLTHSKGLSPTTSVSIEINGQLFEENSSGDGQYDAFWNALHKIYDKQKLKLPNLIDYAVRIPPGSNSDALCETTITWKSKNKEFTTRGLDSDQTVSAIKATEKMLNII